MPRAVLRRRPAVLKQEPSTLQQKQSQLAGVLGCDAAGTARILAAVPTLWGQKVDSTR